MTSTTFTIGQVVQLKATFKNLATALVDPTTVALAFIDPSGNTTTVTYAMAEITKASTGVYTYNLTLDEAGTFYYRWYSTGTGAGASQGQLVVEPSYV